MIGSLKGLLLIKQPPTLLVEVAGVGYELEAPMSTFYELPAINQEVFLYTHLAVRDDAHLLFAFAKFEERLLFRQLIKVNNVGPKLALGILSALSPNMFVTAVQQNNSGALERIPGVGKKTAQRLVMEMRDRLQDWMNDAGDGVFTMAIEGDNVKQDAISALVALGYKQPMALKIINTFPGTAASSEELIKFALQTL